ncbi:SH3 domain-containing protein [Emticicia sp. 17c]|uniref:SH3 domain-containing protein n=1 Tax=Emticicia sp. 17c TaxID=3127704 RepID=UPI00301CA660
MRIVLIILLLPFYGLKAQENYVEKFQGFWGGHISNDPESKMYFYEIVKNNNKLSITYEKDKIMEVLITRIGFVNQRKDSLVLADLKNSGKYLCDCIIKKEISLDCFFIEGFDKEGNSYWYGNTDIYDFNKIPALPQKVITDLLKWDSGKVKRDYLKEFMEKNIFEITVNKTNIFFNIDTPTRMYLIKGDEVEALEEKGEWLKIRYYGKKIIEGWIKKSNLGMD